MNDRRPLVRSASDPAQVQRAKDTETFRKEQQAADLNALLATDFGRRYLWRILDRTQVFASIFVTSSEIYYKAGQQDIGHWLMKEIGLANPEAFLLMQREASKLDAQTSEPEPSPED